YDAKAAGRTSSVFILGGGSPKNFMLQTEPQIQEVMGIDEKGHDYFLQCTDARPDTGGLSGATPAEAVSWGKVDPQTLPDCVVAYVDSTVSLPLLTAYCLSRVPKRPHKRLYDRRDELLGALTQAYLDVGSVAKVQAKRHLAKRATGAGKQAKRPSCRK
ncbi:MAG: deoxyhypusine synthase family protein, partial [Limisphaerales bacterium]